MLLLLPLLLQLLLLGLLLKVGMSGWGFARTDGKEGLVVLAPPFSPPFDSPRRSAEEAATCVDMVERLTVGVCVCVYWRVKGRERSVKIS